VTAAPNTPRSWWLPNRGAVGNALARGARVHGGFLSCSLGPAQHQRADGAHRGRPADPVRVRYARMTCRDQVAVPTQDGLGTNQQSGVASHLAGESVQQGGEQRSVGGGESYLLAVQLPLQDGELVSEREDLSVFGPVTHRQQSQHRKRVGHAEVRQSQ
jgi:hypothetical protein